jgi:hypothetical protein
MRSMNDDARGASTAVVACMVRALFGMSDSELVERLELVQRMLRRLEATLLAIVREVDGRGLARREGARSLASWLRDRFRMSIFAASRLVRLATALDTVLPATRVALASGAVSGEQAWAIKTSVERLPDTVDPAIVAEAEAALVEHAGQLDPAALRTVGERILEHVAPEVAEEHERRRLQEQLRQAWDRRRLTFTPDGCGGVRINGYLDAETAAFVQAGIDALAAPRNRRPASTCEPSGRAEARDTDVERFTGVSGPGTCEPSGEGEAKDAGVARFTGLREPGTCEPSGEGEAKDAGVARFTGLREPGTCEPSGEGEAKDANAERFAGLSEPGTSSPSNRARPSGGALSSEDAQPAEGARSAEVGHLADVGQLGAHAEPAEGALPARGGQSMEVAPCAGDRLPAGGGLPVGGAWSAAGRLPAGAGLSGEDVPSAGGSQRAGDQPHGGRDVRADPPGSIGAGRAAGVSAGCGWDERTAQQRRADALREVFAVAFASERLPDHGGDRPSVVVTVDYDAVSQRLGVGTLDTGERLSPEAVRRLACDARLIPAVLDGPGQPLDLGRERRLFTGAVRRALVLRDGGCAFPGCDRPPKWCDGHHCVHWLDGGPTRLDNGVLLCFYHHALIHQGEWQARIAADLRPEFIPPPWVDPERKPQRNHRPPRTPRVTTHQRN